MNQAPVAVIGGGAAGMEAARVAALRGHSVTLYEKQGYLGGKLPFAAAVKGQHENIADLNAYLQRQQEVCGVTVVTGQEVDADFVRAQAPDVLIEATGGVVVPTGLAASGSIAQRRSITFLRSCSFFTSHISASGFSRFRCAATNAPLPVMSSTMPFA